MSFIIIKMDSIHYVALPLLDVNADNITTAILYAMIHGKRYVVIEGAKRNGLDLTRLNSFTTKLGLRVLDATDVKLRVLSLKYGTMDKVIDVTDKLMGIFGFENVERQQVLHLVKHVNLNDIVGDPLMGVAKFLYIKYQINEQVEYLVYPENGRKDIYIDATKLNQGPVSVVDFFDFELQQQILSHVHFNEVDQPVVVSTETIVEGMYNFIHLDDSDATIERWCELTQISDIEYWSKLTDNYFKLIKQHCPKDQKLVVVSDNHESGIIRQLRVDGYDLLILDHQRSTQQYNTVVATQCPGNVIIGIAENHHTFGQTVINSEPKGKIISFDMNDIAKE